MENRTGKTKIDRVVFRALKEISGCKYFYENYIPGAIQSSQRLEEVVLTDEEYEKACQDLNGKLRKLFGHLSEVSPV